MHRAMTFDFYFSSIHIRNGRATPWVARVCVLLIEAGGRAFAPSALHTTSIPIALQATEIILDPSSRTKSKAL